MLDLKQEKQLLRGLINVKKILCYGDSNTYGHNPLDCSRLDIRWTKVLSELLGNDYEIIEEGLCGRTTVFDDAFDPCLNGKNMLEPIIKTHKPLDLIIIMLGTNDIQLQFNQNAFGVSRGIETLIKTAKNPFIYGIYGDAVPEILVVSPILIDKAIKNSFFADIYGTTRAVDISKQLAPQYERTAKLYNVHFMNAANYAKASKLDGVHMDAENHKKLAAAFAEKIKEILK